MSLGRLPESYRHIGDAIPPANRYFGHLRLDVQQHEGESLSRDGGARWAQYSDQRHAKCWGQSSDRCSELRRGCRRRGFDDGTANAIALKWETSLRQFHPNRAQKTYFASEGS